jgi:hypothetical protein
MLLGAWEVDEGGLKFNNRKSKKLSLQSIGLQEVMNDVLDIVTGKEELSWNRRSGCLGNPSMLAGAGGAPASTPLEQRVKQNTT